MKINKGNIILMGFMGMFTGFMAYWFIDALTDPNRILEAIPALALAGIGASVMIWYSQQ